MRHHGGTAGCVENHVAWYLVGGQQRFPPLLFRECPPHVIFLDYHDLRAGFSGEKRGAKTDRAGADDDRCITILYPGARHSVGSDAKSLDQRELVERKLVRSMQQPGRDRDEILHPPVSMYAEHLQALAAIASPRAACVADLAIKVRIDGAPVSGLNAKLVLWRIQHDPGEFVAEHTRIDVGGVAPGECMKVRPAHSDSLDGEERFTLNRGGFRDISPEERPWSSQNHLLHIALQLDEPLLMRKYAIAIADGQGLSCRLSATRL